jgi:hypothetical protein
MPKSKLKNSIIELSKSINIPKTIKLQKFKVENNLFKTLAGIIDFVFVIDYAYVLDYDDPSYCERVDVVESVDKFANKDIFVAFIRRHNINFCLPGWRWTAYVAVKDTNENRQDHENSERFIRYNPVVTEAYGFEDSFIYSHIGRISAHIAEAIGAHDCVYHTINIYGRLCLFCTVDSDGFNWYCLPVCQCDRPSGSHYRTHNYMIFEPIKLHGYNKIDKFQVLNKVAIMSVIGSNDDE